MSASAEIAQTPEPPYYAVIFTSTLTADTDGYDAMATRMVELAREQPGFLGMESARGSDGLGITVSYWQDVESIRAWKAVGEHRAAQATGKSRWYEHFAVRISKVERAY
ncbi:antibiotic biosynthesis monooxygenase family protein [Synoicihabitans lomoniglobus]|uniref:Antibiotic biosynthesis monooxygenase n=1 Tax=Synoicihabitans lomoniglobus TaxID=2909285 RepID=A0AAE9ZVI4_9BACT|nr:antibiotic biosynthesis monooxygenase [Opitutaceae bacterium LMO-M01]WED64151.1 antibiotic biosynthesis monooxygenase [Opitutaceae bacterium LMO-M01]